MLVYGESGAGKTSLTKTLDGKVLIINAENGSLSLKGLDSDVYDLTKGEIGGQVIELDRTQRFHKLESFLLEIGSYRDKYDWLVFDSLTEIAQNLIEGLKSEYGADGFKVWGTYSEKLIGMMKTLRDVFHFNVLFLALDTVAQDENGQRFIDINIQGKKAAEAIPAQFDFVFHLKKFTDDEGQDKRVLVTSSYKNIKAKDRSGKLNQFEEPNISKIIKKIKGENND